MKFVNKSIAVAFAAIPMLARAVDTDERAYLNFLPRSQTVDFQTPDGIMGVSVSFTLAAPLVPAPTTFSFDDVYTHTPQVEVYDRLSLERDSEFRLGDKKYSIHCLKIHGRGDAAPGAPLNWIQLSFPVDDPDGQFIGPFNPRYKEPGERKFRWNKYLTVYWDEDSHLFNGAHLHVDGVTYGLNTIQK